MRRHGEGAIGSQRRERRKAAAAARSVGLALSDVAGGARIDGIGGDLGGGDMLQVGDIVVTADRTTIHSAARLSSYLRSLDTGSPVLFEVRRGGATHFVGETAPSSARRLAETPGATWTTEPESP